MSIEANLASIAASLATIADLLTMQAIPSAPTLPATVPVMIPTEQNIAAGGNVQPAATPAATATVTPIQPEVAPATVASASPSSCPITDQPSLVSYVMTSYKEMGPVKGNQIQGVLAALNIANINDAKPEQYAAIFNGVESLKVQ